MASSLRTIYMVGPKDSEDTVHAIRQEYSTSCTTYCGICVDEELVYKRSIRKTVIANLVRKAEITCDECADALEYAQKHKEPKPERIPDFKPVKLPKPPRVVKPKPEPVDIVPFPEQLRQFAQMRGITDTTILHIADCYLKCFSFDRAIAFLGEYLKPEPNTRMSEEWLHWARFKPATDITWRPMPGQLIQLSNGCRLIVQQRAAQLEYLVSIGTNAPQFKVHKRDMTKIGF